MSNLRTGWLAESSDGDGDADRDRGDNAPIQRAGSACRPSARSPIQYAAPVAQQATSDQQCRFTALAANESSAERTIDELVALQQERRPQPQRP